MKNTEKMLDVCGGMEVLVDVEIGRVQLTLRQFLEMNVGSIYCLNKFTGENADVIVNKKAVAKGEIVSIDDNFGVRIREIEGLPENEVSKLFAEISNESQEA